MKYALKFTPGTEIETTMYLWFQDHGAYYITDRSDIVQEAGMGFLNTTLQPASSESVEIVSFDQLPPHIQGYDPRDIVGKTPREYPDAR